MTLSRSGGDHTASTRDPVLELSETTVRFDQDRGEARVLNGVDLSIERNEILGVVGESGSGKSMFADSLLNAVVEPGVVTGSVTYRPRDGDPVDVLDLDGDAGDRFRWEEIAMVFQGAMSSFNPVRTIETHFTETLRAHDQSVAEGMERARAALTDLYLDPDRVLAAYPHELSGGMKQRTLIALSLVLEPEVLVMDEPTAALDLLMQRSIISLIEELRAKYDLTIVFITHDLPLVADLADRLAIMYAFEFVEIGPAQEILRRGAHPYTRALLKATPNPTMPISEIRPIEGSGPDPVDVPTGCSYHPRCPLADGRCETEDPASRPVNDAHEVHCHHWEDAADAVPVAYGSDRGRPVDGGTGSETTTARRAAERRADRRNEAPVLSMRDVEVHFETESGLFDFGAEDETVRAVDGVDLDVHDNDVVVLVGESGCGKTTLGKTAIGLVEPTSGTVTFEGQDVWQARHRLGEIDTPYRDIRRSLQIVHQDPGSSLNSMRQVRSILAAPLKQWHRDKRKGDRLEVMMAMLEYVGMTPADDYLNRYPHQLSGGEKQRVALIRAMLMNPDVILADEPISALDVSLRVEMMDLLIELQGRFGTSYLFVSHDLSNARYIAGKTGGRIAVMYLGQIVEIGTVEQIIDDPKHPYTEALRWATPELDPDADATGVRDAPMRGIDVPDPTNPPRGCRYHTRCPRVIPPEEYDFEQAEWNAVMDLKVALERDGFDRSEVRAALEGEGDEDGRSADWLASALRDHFDIPSPLSDEDAERVLATGLDHLASDEADSARDLFEREFSTPCQTATPEPVSATGEGRRVACFLESEEHGG